MRTHCLLFLLVCSNISLDIVSLSPHLFTISGRKILPERFLFSTTDFSILKGHDDVFENSFSFQSHQRDQHRHITQKYSTYLLSTRSYHNTEFNESETSRHQYDGFVLNSSRALPEKRGYKRARDEERIRTRFERQADRANDIRENFLSGNMNNDEGEAVNNNKKQERRFERNVQQQENLNNISNQQRINNGKKRQKLYLYDLAKSMKSLRSDKDRKELLDNTKLSSRGETDLIRLLGSQRAYQPMIFLLDHSSNGPSVHSYTSAIAALSQSSHNNDRKKALELLDIMPEHGIIPNSFTFTAAFLAVDGPVKAREMMNRIRKIETENMNDFVKHDSLYNIFTFNSAIHSCSRGKSSEGFQTAYEFYQTMEKHGIPPNEKTLASILHCAAKSISFLSHASKKKLVMNDALDFLYRMRFVKGIQPSSKAWGAALSVCAAAGADDKGEEIFRSMEETGCEKNIMHYNQYLSVLAKAGKDEKVWEVFEDMRLNSNVMPEIVTLNTVLGSFARTSNYQKAVELLNRMKQGEFELCEERNGRDYVATRGNNVVNKLLPDTISYNSVLSACSDAKEAYKLVNEMRMSRRKRSNLISPTSVTYTNAITACRKSNPPDFETAKKLFQLATESDGITPNVFMYSSLIWTAERCKYAEEAVNILSEMQMNGCKPNIVSYDGVFSALASQVLQGNCSPARSLEMIETAIYAFEEMNERSVSPTPLTFQKLALSINNHFAFKTSETKSESDIEIKISLLERVLSKMSKNELRLSSGGAIIKSIILAYGNANRYNDAKKVFKSIQGERDEQTFSAILYACSKSVPAQWEDAVSLLQQHSQSLKRNKKNEVSPMLLNYAVIACSKQNKWNEAMDLIEEYYSFSTDSPSESVPASKATLSVAALNALTAACGRCGRTDVAVSLMNDMPSKYGVTPDERTYRSVIIACNQAEHEKQRQNYVKKISASDDDFDDDEEDDDLFELQWWECALSLFRRMQEDKLSPDVQTYSSVISCCQAAGQWQRAIGVLQSMIKEIERQNNVSSESASSLNLFCCNAAIAACEKGGAWIEALSLYEIIKSNDKIEPNFVTINSVLMALDEAGQKELAGEIYSEALQNRIISPWKYRREYFGGSEIEERIRVLDLHQFSVPMAKVAVSSVMESLLESHPMHNKNDDLIIIVGKGKGSDPITGPVLSRVIQKLLISEFSVCAEIDDRNSGRLRIRRETLYEYILERSWRTWDELEEDSV